MRIGFLLLCFYALSSSVTQASTLIDIGSSSCSGSESINSSNGLNFSCSGDFSLTAGSLSSDIGITLSSLGKLTLDGLTLSAPNITLNATNIDIGSSLLLDVSQGLPIQAELGGTLSIIPRLWSAPIVQLPLSTGGITINDGSRLSYGGSIALGLGSIVAGSGISLAGGELVLYPSASISLAGNLTLLSDGAIITGTSIPLPGSFSALLTGLLMLASVSRHRIIRTAQ